MVPLSSENLYSFSIKDKKLKILSTIKNKGIKRYQIQFTSELTTPYKENNLVYLKFFLPSSIEKGLTSIVHGFGAKNTNLLEKYVCEKLASRGIPNFILELPYHLRRTPKDKKSGEVFARMDANQSYLFFDQAQKDIRKAFHLLRENFSLKQTFNILGISLGGIVSFITAALEETILRVILAFSGGCFHTILWSPFLKRLIKHDCSYKECLNNYKKYLGVYKEVKNKDDLLRLTEIKECLIYEPLSFVNFFNNKKVLIFAGIFDEMVPFKSSLLLHNSLKNSTLIKLPSFHYTGFLFNKIILRKTMNFIT